MRAEHKRRVCGENPAIARYQSNVMLGHLPPPPVAARLNHGLADRSHPPHIKGTELTAAGVNRQRTVGPDIVERVYRAVDDLLAGLEE